MYSQGLYISYYANETWQHPLYPYALDWSDKSGKPVLNFKRYVNRRFLFPFVYMLHFDRFVTLYPHAFLLIILSVANKKKDKKILKLSI